MNFTCRWLNVLKVSYYVKKMLKFELILVGRVKPYANPFFFAGGFGVTVSLLDTRENYNAV